MNKSRMSLLLAGTLLASSAMYAQQPLPQSNPQAPGSRNDLSNSANTVNGIDANSPAVMADKAFLRKAAEGGMAEIQFGQLASQKGSSDDVKQFGQKMVTDHTQLNAELKPFADAKGVSAPKKLGKKEQTEYNKLNGLSGDAFDKEYVSMMVADHQKDMKDFTSEANSTSDPQLKAVVQKGADVVQQHLTSIQDIAKAKGITAPMSGGQ